MNTPPLSPSTSLGRVDLRVSNTDRSRRFYTDVIGLAELSSGPVTVLGTDADTQLVALHEHPDAPPQGKTAGIYHFALLFPTRLELANVAARIARSGTPIQGATDHGTHEAIYLPDPDGIGIELAWDRPRHLWPTPADRLNARIGMQPLDLDELLSLVPSIPDAPSSAGAGLTMGHLHFHVSGLDAGRQFYEQALGMEEQMAIPTAAFASANGYHHHVAFNTWRGDGAPPMNNQALGLQSWTLNVSAHDMPLILDRLAALGFETTHAEDGDQAVVATDSDGIPALIQVLQ